MSTTPAPDTPFVERRADASASASIVFTLNRLDKTVRQLDVCMAENMKEHRQELAEAVAEIMKKSFPEGDPDGHRRHHEAVIKAAEDKSKFWADMRLSVAKWGVIGFLGWLALNSWTGFLQGPHK